MRTLTQSLGQTNMNVTPLTSTQLVCPVNSEILLGVGIISTVSSIVSIEEDEQEYDDNED